MAGVTHLKEFGNQLAILFDDGSQKLAYPTGGGLWIVRGKTTVTDPDPGGGGSDPGGGTGTGDGSIFNPWGDMRPGGVDGWESHRSYSQGGDDWSWGAGQVRDVVAPAAGALYTSGGSGEFAAGFQGSAGRREVLMLDKPVSRVTPRSLTVMSGGTVEAEGPMVAIVFQHLSVFGEPGHYAKGASGGASGMGVTGNSNGGGGGDWHIHVHGLDASGRRVDFIKFV